MRNGRWKSMEDSFLEGVGDRDDFENTVDTDEFVKALEVFVMSTLNNLKSWNAEVGNAAKSLLSNIVNGEIVYENGSPVSVRTYDLEAPPPQDVLIKVDRAVLFLEKTDKISQSIIKIIRILTFWGETKRENVNSGNVVGDGNRDDAEGAFSLVGVESCDNVFLEVLKDEMCFIMGAMVEVEECVETLRVES